MPLRQRTRRRRGVVIGLVALGLAALAAPLFAHRLIAPVQFNQFLIEKADASYGVTPIASRWARFRSVYGSGVNALLHLGERTAPDIDQPDEVLKFVLSWAPRDAIVYPTEIFYYFRFVDRQGREVWGNLRIAEVGEGRIGISYFHPGSERFSHMIFDADDGLTVTPTGGRAYSVSFAGERVRFHIPPVATTPPPSLALDADERYVGRVVDESGVRFHLVFSERTSSFYMLLDDSAGTPDRLERTDDGLMLGGRTGFAYYDEPGLDRRLLVGVRLNNIAENNYFDGPGDQVPFELTLRDLLHRAYPHTMLDPGIDEHGVLLGTSEWQRIAVTPFQRYRNLDEVHERIAEGLTHAEGPLRRTAMTKEWWNSPMWVAMKTYELRAEGKNLTGPPPGLLGLDELLESYPPSMFASAPEGPPEAVVTSNRPTGTPQENQP